MLGQRQRVAGACRRQLHLVLVPSFIPLGLSSSCHDVSSSSLPHPLCIHCHNMLLPMGTQASKTTTVLSRKDRYQEVGCDKTEHAHLCGRVSPGSDSSQGVCGWFPRYTPWSCFSSSIVMRVQRTEHGLLGLFCSHLYLSHPISLIPLLQKKKNSLL